MADLETLLRVTAGQLSSLPTIGLDYYGSVTLIYQSGRVVRVETTRSILPIDIAKIAAYSPQHPVERSTADRS